MVESRRKPRRLFASRRRSLIAVGLLVAALGLGGYFGVRYWLGWSHLRRAEDALARNRLEEARQELDDCLRIWPHDAQAHFLAARTARRLGDFKAFEEHLEASKARGWDAKQIRLERTLLQAQRDSPGPVAAFLLTLVKSNDADSDYILEALIQGFLKDYQLPQAHECADLWLQREPDNGRALVWRGIALKEALRYREATADFQRAVDVDPDDREARFRLGEVLLEQNQADEAAAHYEWLYAHEPESSEARMGLAQCRVTLGRLDEAQELLDRLLREHPTSALVLSESGKLALKQSKPAEAEDLLRRAVAIDPYEPETVFAYSQALTQRGKPEEARKWLDAHRRIRADLERLAKLNRELIDHQSDPKPPCEIGVIFLRTGREKQGLHWLYQSLRKDRHYPPAHAALAEYFEHHGLPREAAKHREQATTP